ncbi:MAG: peptide-methionine (R)-S-oxide reductase MsrB [Flavobacteriales bacterium]
MKEFEVQKSEEKWKEELSKEEYHILREAGTERPGSGKYYKSKADGIYHCAGCGNPLFDSEHKFDSGSGWPSFYKSAKEGSIVKRPDNSMGTTRTEVLCGKCGGHLGHVFDDGPDPTGKRFCINSAALDLEKR